MLIRMALRNLSRYRMRSTITIIAIVISVFSSVVVDGLLRGLSSASEYNLVTYESSEAMIYAEGYFEEKDSYPSDILIDSRLKEELTRILASAGIAYAPRYKSTAEIISYDTDSGFEASLHTVLIGIEPAVDGDVYALAETVESGSWLDASSEGAVVGGTIAKKLGLSVGSFISISCKGRDGFNEIIEAEVQGIFVCDNTQLNGSAVFMSLGFLDELLALAGSVSEISLSDGMLSIASDSFTADIEKIIPAVDGISIYDWRDVNAELVSVMSGKSGASYMLLILLFIIAAAGIVNTMIMAVMERRKECAMLRAVGFSSGHVNSIFVFEGLFLGIIGSAIGIIFALIVNYPLSRYGIDLTGMFPSDLDIGYRISFVFRSGWYAASFFLIPSAAVFLSTVSAFLPVFRSGRSEVAELLRRP